MGGDVDYILGFIIPIVVVVGIIIKIVKDLSIESHQRRRIKDDDDTEK